MNSTNLSFDLSTLDRNGSGTIEIMPLGDSITRGEDAITPIALQNGYRDNLGQLLDDANIDVDFVGSLSHGNGFDANHEGHGGKTIGYLSDNIDQWLALSPPEVVLLQAGTNDMGFFSDRTPESAIDQLEILIDRILSQSPNTPVLVTAIAPANTTRLANSIYAPSILPDFSTRIDDFNARLPALVSRKASAGKLVSLVNAGQQLNANANLSSDGLHPNDSGYAKMVSAYFNSIQNLLDTNPSPASIVGTSNDDRLGGTVGDDSIIGLGGNDVLYGFDGADTLAGGDGSDKLYGAEDNDSLDGGNGNDFLDGGNGNDRLNGSNGNDLLVGRAGNDILEGRNGNDALSSGEGNDFLNGGSGNDQLDGGSGNDFFKGGSGRDRLYGVAGDDFLEGGSGNDILLGGAGNDTLKGTEEVALTAQVDVLDGGSGRDLYIVQTASQAAYATAGNSDYALIRSFDLATDRIALGTGTYRISDTGGQAGIFDGQNDLIAIVERYRAGDLDINDGRVFLRSYSI